MIVSDLIEINRRLFHDLWNMADVSSQPNGLSPRLILPEKRDKAIRFSEQEARFLYCSLLNSMNYFYSVETPTEQTYKQTGRTSVSAASDLSLYVKKNDGFKKIANVEFKAHNPQIAHIKKDIEKLIREGIVGNWFHLLKNIHSGTLPTLFNKISGSFKDNSKYVGERSLSFVFSFCVLDKKWACLKHFMYDSDVDNFDGYVDEFFNLKYTLRQGKIEISENAGWNIIENEKC